MKKNDLMLKQLERQFKDWREIYTKYQKPRQGWVKTIRKALGMTSQQFADRLGVRRSRVVQLEHAETQDAVTLKAIKAAANAMDCEFIYAIVPRQTILDMLKARAYLLAVEKIKRVDQSMLLEDQRLTQL